MALEGGGHFAHPVLGEVKLYTVRSPPCVDARPTHPSPRIMTVLVGHVCGTSSDLFRLIDTWREPILSHSYSVIFQLQLRSCLSFNRCSAGEGNIGILATSSKVDIASNFVSPLRDRSTIVEFWMEIELVI